VTLSPASTFIDQKVTASVSGSTVPNGVTITKITLGWGDNTKISTLHSLASTGAHRYLQPGRYTVVVTLTPKNGRSVTGSAVELVTVPPPTGSYTGTTSVQTSDNGITLYVSGDRTQLQDISIPSIVLSCAPGGASLGDQLVLDSVPLASNSYFATTGSRSSVYDGYPATDRYTFKGHFHGVNSVGAAVASGTLTDTLTYTDSTTRTCKSGVQSWSVARDAQPAQTTKLPPTGSYAGTTSVQTSDDGITLYVSGDRKQLQDISIPSIVLSCAPGGSSLGDQLVLDSVPLASNGYFATTATQSSIYDGYPATYKYTFKGHFHGVDSTGSPRAAGSFTDTLSYTNGATAWTCKSGVQSWSLARDAQPAQTTKLPPTGSYAGTTSVQTSDDGITLYVSGDRTQLQDISIPSINLSCAPGGASLRDQFVLDSVPLVPSGYFATTATQSNVYDGYPATYKYTLRGHFHGVNGAGAARAAGSFTDTLTYSNGATTYTCKSGVQSWSLARDAQPAQTTKLPPTGSYAGTTSVQTSDNGITLDVSGNRTRLQDILIPSINLSCAPGGASAGDQLVLNSAPLASNGYVAETATQTRTYDGYKATYRYTFRGHFHGVDSTGSPRAAGSFTDTLTYSNGATAYTCKSGVQSWYVTKAAG
jgi:hypothetical protein